MKRKKKLSKVNTIASIQLLILGIQAEDVQAFIPELLSNLHIETLIHGNATKEDALKLTRVVEENLGAKSLDFESVEGTRSLLLPTGTPTSHSTNM
jgi:insulysin